MSPGLHLPTVTRSIILNLDCGDTMKRKTYLKSAVSALALAAVAALAAEAGTIEGRVSDSSGSVSLEGVKVRISETGATTATNRAGEFRFNQVPGGTFTLTFTYVGADPVTVRVTLPDADATVRRDVAMGEGDVEPVENILIVGQRGSMNSGLSRERAADDMRSVLSADAIGQFPDENVAEAAKRAPGVNVLNDQGEGRFVSIRGLDPNLNSTSINGVRVPSPEGGDRSVPLDVIESDLLSAIIINKSLTPDMEADSIGGNVEVETISGLDHKDAFFKAKAASSYADLTETTGQKYSVVYANQLLDNTLGMALSLSYRHRPFGSDNTEIDGAEWNIGPGELYPEEMEMRHYRITRDRFSSALNLDWAPSDMFEGYIHSIYSRFTDDEKRSRIEAKFGDGDFNSMSGNVALIDGTPSDEYEVDRDLKDRLETQTIYSIVSGGTYYTGPYTLEFSASYSDSQEREPRRMDTGFRAKFDSGQYGVKVGNTLLPSFVFPSFASETMFYDATNYEFDGLEYLNGVTSDSEAAFKIDLTRDSMIFNNPGSLKTGFKISNRDKDRDVNIQVYDGYSGLGMDDLSDVARTVSDFSLDSFGPAPSADKVRKIFQANRGLFDLHEFDTAIGSNAEDYEASEDIYAGYLMGSWDADDWRVVLGLRVEHTRFEATGYGITELEQVFAGDVTGTVTPGDLTPLVPGAELITSLDTDYDIGDDETTVEAIYRSELTTKTDYTDWLPSINVRYDYSDNIIARFAYYRSIVRPNISAVVPAAEIAQEESDLEGSLGNPDLERQRAHNLDASLSWYPTKTSVLSGGVFYKRISDYIATQTFSNYDFYGLTFDEASIAVNLNDVDLMGVELNYQQQFTFWPGPLSGVIAGANMTYVDADVTLNDGSSVALPRQSELVWNLVLGYDKGPIDVRLAATHRDEYIDELNLAGDGIHRIIDGHTQIDFSGKYRLNDQFKLYLEAKNITDEPFVAYIQDGGKDLLSQHEEYGYSIEFGLTFTY